jgi:hypothetical protein
MNKKIICDGEEFELVPTAKKDVLPLQIAVLDKGFVYIGRIETLTSGIIIHDAQNIRYWGTTKGLGELALCGKQSTTKLDIVGQVKVPEHALVHLIDCDESKWK